MGIPTYLRVALALELFLAAIECMCPFMRLVLPFGGNAMAQTGILVSLCFVFHEFRNSWRGPPDASD